jgi:hypothetical protein
MSELVFNDKSIESSDIKSINIKIDRINSINCGVRIWYVLLSDNGKYYQRWSMLMNPIDEILFLAQSGDKLAIKYIDDTAEDCINQRYESFDRLIITDVRVIK